MKREAGIDRINFRSAEVHDKGWGREIWIANNGKYCGKLLEFDEGKKFSMHYHMVKSETFYVLTGKLELTIYDLSTADKTKYTLMEGDTIDIPAGNPHRLKAITKSTIIEVSTQHFEEDSYRIIAGDKKEK